MADTVYLDSPTVETILAAFNAAKPGDEIYVGRGNQTMTTLPDKADPSIAQPIYDFAGEQAAKGIEKLKGAPAKADYAKVAEDLIAIAIFQGKKLLAKK